MDTPRICMVFDQRGFVKIVSDVPIRAYFVDESCPRDRVFELSKTVEIGIDRVHQTLKDSPVGHTGDFMHPGNSYGPRKPHQNHRFRSLKTLRNDPAELRQFGHSRFQNLQKRQKWTVISPQSTLSSSPPLPCDVRPAAIIGPEIGHAAPVTGIHGRSSASTTALRHPRPHRHSGRRTPKPACMFNRVLPI